MKPTLMQWQCRGCWTFDRCFGERVYIPGYSVEYSRRFGMIKHVMRTSHQECEGSSQTVAVK